MPNQQQAQSNSSNDNSMDFFWMIVMVIAGVVIVWYFGKDYITDFIFKIKSYEITAINFVVNGWIKFLQLSHLPLPMPQTQELAQWSTFMKTNHQAASFDALTDLATAVGKYLAYPVAIILAGLGVLVYRTNLTAKFKTIFSMQKLKKYEYKDWPQITPVVKLDLVNQDINKGPWAMAVTPMDFAKQNNLLKIEKENGQTNVTLIAGAAHRIFALQLGAVWTAAEKLPIHTQALFAIFAARANRDRENADKILKQIAASSESGQLDFTGVTELVAKHVNTKLIQKVTSKHAYVLTVMASMLELARTDGVLASAEFIWLKPLDRKLWYMLNSVGRQTAVPEIAGAFAHWMAEKKINRALHVPMVDEAAKSLEMAMKEIIYEADDE